MEIDIELDSLDKIIEFIKSDIQGCLKCGVNIGLALILNAYTEFFGHLLTGETAPGNSYNAWLRFMGPPYSRLLDEGHDLYGVIRCGLIHEYTIKKPAFILSKEDGYPGIVIEDGVVYFNNFHYQKDFIDSVEKYRTEIQTDSSQQENYLRFRLSKPIVK